MDKKTKLFFGIIGIVIIISTIFTLNRAFVSSNYEVVAIPIDITE